VFPNLDQFVDDMLRPRPKPTGWQKFRRFVRDDISFIGLMAAIGTFVTGSYLMHWCL
jgi:hypothetical protein